MLHKHNNFLVDKIFNQQVISPASRQDNIIKQGIPFPCAADQCLRCAVCTRITNARKGGGTNFFKNGLLICKFAFEFKQECKWAVRTLRFYLFVQYESI